MILYGASGHAKVVLDICLKNGETISKIIDDDINKKEFINYTITHNYESNELEDNKMIVSIGNNKIRKKIVAKLNTNFGIAVHPVSIIDSSVKLNEGTVVMANVVINAYSIIGRHCIINTSCSIDHDCYIDNFAHISPNATLCGGVFIGEGTHIGAGAVILPNVKIGKWCKVGAGAVVLKDVKENSTVVGNPGKIIK